MAACRSASPTFAPSMPSGATGKRLVVGVDEVGMGALCAPVFAAAVLVRPNTRKIAGVRDSKTLSARAARARRRRDQASQPGVGRRRGIGRGDRADQHPQCHAPRDAARPASHRRLRPRPRRRHEDPWASRSTSGRTRRSSTGTPRPMPSPAPRSSPRSPATGSWPGSRCAIPATAGSATPATPRATTWRACEQHGVTRRPSEDVPAHPRDPRGRPAGARPRWRRRSR